MIIIIIIIHLVSSNSDPLGETPIPNFGFFRILGPYLILIGNLKPIFLVKNIPQGTSNPGGLRLQITSVTSQPLWPKATVNCRD